MKTSPFLCSILHPKKNDAHYYRNCLVPKKENKAQQKQGKPRYNGALIEEKK